MQVLTLNIVANYTVSNEDGFLFDFNYSKYYFLISLGVFGTLNFGCRGEFNWVEIDFCDNFTNGEFLF
jgi:hypothetical protein